MRWKRRCRYWCERRWRVQGELEDFLCCKTEVIQRRIPAPAWNIHQQYLQKKKKKLLFWCLLRWILHVTVDAETCVSAGGGFSITCWSQPELHAAFQNERNKWTVHENTSDIFSAVTCSQTTTEQSPWGNFRGALSPVMGDLIWATLIFTVKREAGENTSLRSEQVREFERAFRSKSEQKHILFLMGMTWWLDTLDSLQGESSNHH